jgi:recombination protein RecA
MARTKTRDPLEILKDKYNVRQASDPYYRLRRVTTGVAAFDRLIGGGVPLGRYIEVYGDLSTLKTTLALKTTVAFLEYFPDKDVLWIDSEGSYDASWAEYLGVDNERVHVIKPETGEDATEILELTLKSHAFCLFVIDSVTALVPTREDEYEPQETNKAMGAMGRMTSAMFRRLTRLLDNEQNAMYIINQTRDAIGVVFGNPSRPTGGKALGYYAGLRVELHSGETVVSESNIVGAGGSNKKRRQTEARMINMRVVKDKCGPREQAFGTIKLSGLGGNLPHIDEEESLLALGIEDGLVERNAAAVTIFPNSSKFKHSLRGWENAREYLQQNPRQRERLARRIAKRSEQLGSVSTA